ncbi:uncharacterized protein LOC132404482 [Hypanus sabinus]|uniref:uncharacterized protein LOC132404482 n=1 Tax=Hypanus sabinus TaxID=79690 RepID=UPI0028C3F5E7|nr:uncharacterized protein LOC132404482 [Hypanus sabinus]
MQIQTTVNYHQKSLPLSSLVDSSAKGDLLEKDIASQAGIPQEPLSTPLEARALDRRLLARVTHCTPPLTSILSGNIKSSNLQKHIHHVCQVLRRLWENKLFVKVEKCEFHAPSVSFLGYIIESGQVRADPEKIRAVAEWPRPLTRKQLQRFLRRSQTFSSATSSTSTEFLQISSPIRVPNSFHKSGSPFVKPWVPLLACHLASIHRRMGKQKESTRI